MSRPAYPWRYFLGGCVAMLVLTPLAQWGLSGKFFTDAVIFGWLINMIHAYTAAQICRQAIGRALTGFFFWAFVVNAIRTSLLLIIIVVLLFRVEVDPEHWIASLMAGYFCCMAAEVLSLNALSRKEPESDG